MVNGRPPRSRWRRWFWAPAPGVAAVEPHPLLGVEHRAPGGQLDQHRDQQQHRQQHDEREQGQQEVERPGGARSAAAEARRAEAALGRLARLRQSLWIRLVSAAAPDRSTSASIHRITRTAPDCWIG